MSDPMNQVLRPFDTYHVDYGTTNPNGYDLTRIEFYYGGKQVGQLLSGKAIGPGSYVSLKDGVIYLYFSSERLANLFAILQGESHLALYFVPDDADPEREQGREGGICHRRHDDASTSP
jgi:hypothetical protein